MNHSFLKNFFVIISLLGSIATGTAAQTKGLINYKLTVKSPMSPNPYEVNFMHYFNGSKSIELAIKVHDKALKDSLSDVEFRRVVASGKPMFVFKDLNAKRMVLTDDIVYKKYLIEDTLNNFKWKIGTEHQILSNYKCTKATLNFRGRNYTAWFAEEIPLQNGPWKFSGLPGLIFKVYDDEEIFTYELTGINFNENFDAAIIRIPQEFSKEKPITHQEFIGLVNKKIKDFKSMSKIVTSGVNGQSKSGTVRLAEKLEKY